MLIGCGSALSLFVGAMATVVSGKYESMSVTPDVCANCCNARCFCLCDASRLSCLCLSAAAFAFAALCAPVSDGLGTPISKSPGCLVPEGLARVDGGVDFAPATRGGSCSEGFVAGFFCAGCRSC